MESVEITLVKIQKDIAYIREAHKKCFEDIKGQQSRMIESYNGKFKMTDDRITKECEVISGMNKRLQKVEIKQAVVVTKLAMLFSGAVFGVYFLFEKAYHIIFK